MAFCVANNTDARTGIVFSGTKSFLHETMKCGSSSAECNEWRKDAPVAGLGFGLDAARVWLKFFELGDQDESPRWDIAIVGGIGWLRQNEYHGFRVN